MKKGRRKAREEALQILYQLDLNEELNLQSALYRFEVYFRQKELKADGEDFEPMDNYTQRLVTGVVEKKDELDGVLKAHSENWRLDRMPAVDRNLLRIGAFELLFCDDVPTTVSIDEMIEIAKTYGSEQSPQFINAVLDKISSGLQNPNKAP